MGKYDISEFSSDESLPLAVEFIPAGGTQPNKFHKHAYSKIILITQGKAVHRIGTGKCVLKKGDVLLIAPNCVHGYDDTRELELLNIIYDANLLIPGIESCKLPLTSLLFPDTLPAPKEMLRPVMRLVDDIDIASIIGLAERLGYEARHKIPGRQIQLIAIFMQIVVYLGRYSAPGGVPLEHPEGVKAVAHFINSNYSKKFSTETLRKSGNMSERSLFRNFKNAYGCTPKQYLQHVRVQRAYEMLTSTRKSIDEIAFDCGFCDGNHFSKVFKKIMKESPGKVRKVK